MSSLLTGPPSVDSTSTEVVRVAIVNDFEIVAAGLAAMLEPFTDRVEIIEVASLLEVASEVDVVLYDAFSRGRVVGPVEKTVNMTSARVAIYTWNLHEQLVAEGLANGAAGFISKAIAAEDLVTAIEQIHAGRTVVHLPVNAEQEEQATSKGAWPGREFGLTARESEVLALVASGLSNQEIAERIYISINSVKSFIRHAYRKIEVTSRSQAVLWAIRHGFVPRSARTRTKPAPDTATRPATRRPGSSPGWPRNL
ncbi:response regulator transcription factor [Rudaeicoccus suwonensis]|nr:response regulator transcription factor [Rudaeicoccus suwonensis]